MLKQKQPSKWSCLPTAFAMVINTPVEQLILETGHDGAEIIWPRQPEPQKRRSWHVQEIIKACYSFGYITMPYEQYVRSKPVVSEKPFDQDFTETFNYFLYNERGVVAVKTSRGSGHALAFDHGVFVDPATGLTTGLRAFVILDILWIVNQIKKP